MKSGLAFTFMACVILGWLSMSLATIGSVIYAIYLFGPAGATLGMALWTAAMLWIKMMVGGFVLLVVGYIGCAMGLKE